MRQSHQTHDMKEFRALGECYRVLVEEASRSSALLREAGQRPTVVARDDGASSWTPTKTKSEPTPRSSKRPAVPVGAENE